MLDRTGYKRKTYDEIVTEMSARAKELYGADANVSDRAVLGIIIRLVAWFLALLYMDVEETYHSGYRKSAEGVQLYKLLPFAGITINLEEYAFGKVTLQGTPGHPVESGFLLGKNNSDVTYETIGSVTLNSNGVGVVDIVCTEIGSIGNTDIGTITEIVNTDANVESVINHVACEGGREKETDLEARARADITVEGQGNGTPEAIRSKLLSVANVRAAQVIENTADMTDVYGTPSRGIQAFVLGGDDEDIAQAILKSKTGGIGMHGTTTVITHDSSKNEQVIMFTRAAEINLYARAVITTDVTFEQNGNDQVRDAIVQYIGGAGTDEALYAGLNMGDDVIVAKAMFATLKVAGVTDIDLEFSVDGITFTKNNVVITSNQVAQIDAANIEVTHNV